MKSIFVQIASYRDPELIPTLNSLLENAKYPDHLTICIAHQHSKEDPWDSLALFHQDKRFIIIDIPCEDSQGTCWARNQVQQHYNNQDYTLQLDSHHRFVKDWDEILINTLVDLQQKGHPKPLLTTYLPSYSPDSDKREPKPWGMSFDKFTPEGVVFFLPYAIDEKLNSPRPARFYSAHFAFTLGIFCKEVPHDPLFYFHGEEITIAVRAYTWGYDLFHPHILIAWHEYTRQGRAKHWDDHQDWVTQNDVAYSRTRMLLGIDQEICSPCSKKTFTGYDLGEERSLKDYEQYSGIRFRDRAVQPSTLNNNLPQKRTEPYVNKVNYNFRFYKSSFQNTDYVFVAVILEDKQGKEIYRKDFQKDTIQQWYLQDIINIELEYMGSLPYKWVVWPYSLKNKWVDRIEHII